MLCTIKNDYLTVDAETFGAELRSVRSEQTEYLWQGDARTWTDHAPTLFPYVGRATGGQVTYNGKNYSMKIHGLAPTSEFELVEQKPSSMTMLLSSNEETQKAYPFKFRFYVTWSLEGNKLVLSYHVFNDDVKTMYFGLGAHPGIRLPLEQGLRFEDYYLQFEPEAAPIRVGFSQDCFVNGEDKAYPLERGNRLSLRHDLFDDDAIVMKHQGHTVTLAALNGHHAVKAYFPDQAYFGTWHWPKSEASYVCLEPWSSLPSRKGIVEDLQTQPTLLSLQPGGEYKTEISFTFI